MTYKYKTVYTVDQAVGNNSWSTVGIYKSKEGALDSYLQCIHSEIQEGQEFKITAWRLSK